MAGVAGKCWDEARQPELDRELKAGGACARTTLFLIKLNSMRVFEFKGGIGKDREISTIRYDGNTGYRWCHLHTYMQYVVHIIG